MYGHLKQRLPQPIAFVLATAWYVVLLAMAIYGVFEPQAEFQYLAM